MGLIFLFRETLRQSVLFSPMPQCIQQDLGHSGCSKNICGISLPKVTAWLWETLLLAQGKWVCSLEVIVDAVCGKPRDWNWEVILDPAGCRSAADMIGAIIIGAICLLFSHLLLSCLLALLILSPGFPRTLVCNVVHCNLMGSHYIVSFPS